MCIEGTESSTRGIETAVWLLPRRTAHQNCVVIVCFPTMAARKSQWPCPVAAQTRCLWRPSGHEPKMALHHTWNKVQGRCVRWLLLRRSAVLAGSVANRSGKSRSQNLYLGYSSVGAVHRKYSTHETMGNFLFADKPTVVAWTPQIDSCLVWDFLLHLWGTKISWETTLESLPGTI